MSSQPGHQRGGVVFQDLGDLSVEVHGRRRTPGGARPGALLAALLVHANRRVPVDVLTAAVWPDGPPRATSTLESHLWRLRQVLEPDRRPGEASRLLQTEPGGYRLVVDDEQVDSLRFARLAGQAGGELARGQPDAAVRSCEQARRLWRGRPFVAVADQPWAAPTVARLEELRSQLLEHHIGALLELGRTDAALVELGTALAEHPLRERLWTQRMLASYRAGRVDDALSAYARVRALLRDELGTDPGEELRETHRRILAADPGLAGPTPASSPLPPPEGPAPPLPRWTTRTVGREHERDRLGELLVDAPLVTVWGPAGVGKTRLAAEAARRAAPSFPDGTCFVDLSGAGDGDQVVDAIASGLGLSASPSGSGVDALRAFLRHRRVLLLLDDCEHVVDEVARLVEVLAPARGRLCVLVTSRERLELDDETVVELSPLAVLDGSRPGAALVLFLDRWEAIAGPTAPDDLEHARRVCRAVEGVPLALELAAARARTFSLAEVAEQTEEDPSTLSGLGRRRRGPRSSVLAAVERSHRLLDADEQRLHRALAVLPGTFTLRAAAALGECDTARAADLLADLAHRSLLVARAARGAGRPTSFAQLTIVRAHGARALEQAGESDAARARRDAWVLRRATGVRPRLGTVQEKEWSDALADDLVALRATLQHRLVERPSRLGVEVVAGLGSMFWYQHDATAEGSRWVERAAEVAHALGDEVPPLVTVHLAIALATVRAIARRLDLAGPVCDEVVEDLVGRGVTLDEPVLVGDALAVLSTCLWLAGDQARAGRVLDLVAATVDRTGDGTLGLLHRVRSAMDGLGRDDPAGVLRTVAALHDEARRADNRFAAWIASGTAHFAALAAGDAEAALRWSDACLLAIDRSGRRHAPFQLEMRANTLAVLGRHEQARPLYAAARAHVERAGLPWPTLPGTDDLLRRTYADVRPVEQERVGDDVARATVRDLLRDLQLDP